jgi:hypothetical protein
LRARRRHTSRTAKGVNPHTIAAGASLGGAVPASVQLPPLLQLLDDPLDPPDDEQLELEDPPDPPDPEQLLDDPLEFLEQLESQLDPLELVQFELHPLEQLEFEQDGLHCGEKLQLVSLLQLPQSKLRVPVGGGGGVPPSVGAGG